MPTTPSRCEEERQTFHPDSRAVTLYHVWAELSETPYRKGVGITCGVPQKYYVRPSFVITPGKVMEHLDWKNNKWTQFISCYGNLEAALREATKRRRHSEFKRVDCEGIERDLYPSPNSVHIAVIKPPANHKVWAMSPCVEMPRWQRMTDLAQCSRGIYSSDLVRTRKKSNLSWARLAWYAMIETKVILG